MNSGVKRVELKTAEVEGFGDSAVEAGTQALFLVFDRSDLCVTLISVTSAETARRAVVKLKTKNQVCHREATRHPRRKVQGLASEIAVRCHLRVHA
jgi:hypothetical protein